MKIKSPRSNAPLWGLLGIPDHQGVLHVGGRLGAAQGPKAFRAQKQRINPRSQAWKSCNDWGDASPLSNDVEKNIKSATQSVTNAHSKSCALVVVGGGHDHGFSHLNGVFTDAQHSKKGTRLGCINIDAHFDMRKPNPHITSGSPFYLALEAGIIKGPHLVEFGVQNHCNSPELWDYAKKKKTKSDFPP